MVIRTRPFDKKEEIKIKNVIDKGGSTINDRQTQDSYRLTLRIPSPLKEQINEIIKIDPIQPSLTGWILEALKQRLNREKQL